MKEIKLN